MSTNVRAVNIVKTLRLSTIKAILKDEIPISRGRHRGSSMRELKVVKEFEELLDQVSKQHGSGPYEIYGELNMKGPEIEAERTKRKSFPQSFRKLLRQSVKARGLGKEIEVVEYNRGERFFVVGKAA